IFQRRLIAPFVRCFLVEFIVAAGVDIINRRLQGRLRCPWNSGAPHTRVTAVEPENDEERQSGDKKSAACLPHSQTSRIQTSNRHARHLIPILPRVASPLRPPPSTAQS